jgi:hypothetical protein
VGGNAIERGASAAARGVAHPVADARFVLKPHRPPEVQRPPLRASPESADLRWTIDGQPANI